MCDLLEGYAGTVSATSAACSLQVTHSFPLLMCSSPCLPYILQAVFVKRSSVGKAADTSASAPVKKQQAKLSAMWGAKKDSAAEPEEPEEAPSSSGVVVASLQRVSYDFEDEGQKQFHGEGRTITLELDSFFLVACYVPNAGEGLVRLNYRVDEWEVHMREYLQELSKRKPVMYTGDLNCGHLGKFAYYCRCVVFLCRILEVLQVACSESDLPIPYPLPPTPISYPLSPTAYLLPPISYS
jgi:hypothetical protein